MAVDVAITAVSGLSYYYSSAVMVIPFLAVATAVDVTLVADAN